MQVNVAQTSYHCAILVIEDTRNREDQPIVFSKYSLALRFRTTRPPTRASAATNGAPYDLRIKYDRLLVFHFYLLSDFYSNL